MICSKCGTKNNEGDKICNKCKTPLQMVKYEFDMTTSDVLKSDNIEVDNTDSDGINNTDSKTDKKGMKKSVLVAIIVCAVFIFAALFVVLKFNTEKRHNEYIANRTFTFNEDVFVFSFLGLDGYGTPHASVNRQEVFYALMPALGFEEENTNTIPVMKDIYEHIYVTFSEKKDLSNGQIITAQVSVDRTCLEEYDIYFKEVEFQVTVKGLEEIEGVDIFDDIYIDTVETDGLVNVSWEHVGKRSFENIMIESGIKCRPLGSLNYGDKFTLLITSEQAELFKKLYGINPVVLEREYVLQESSNEYLSDFEKVSDRLISIINKEDIETFMKNLELRQGAVENAKYMGGFLYSIEDGEENDDKKNCLVLLYKLDYPFENKDAESMYAWSIHYGVVQNVYGQQKYCTDFSEAGYPNIIYNEEKDKYEGVYVEDALEYVIECKNMQEDRISYDSALKLYLYDDLNEKSE